MTTTVSEMSVAELKELIAQTVEDTLFEFLGDPDEGLEMREELIERLLRQRKDVEAGDRGVSLEEGIRRLSLD